MSVLQSHSASLLQCQNTTTSGAATTHQPHKLQESNSQKESTDPGTLATTRQHQQLEVIATNQSCSSWVRVHPGLWPALHNIKQQTRTYATAVRHIQNLNSYTPSVPLGGSMGSRKRTLISSPHRTTPTIRFCLRTLNKGATRATHLVKTLTNMNNHQAASDAAFWPSTSP
jgi:hypothetical protein